MTALEGTMTLPGVGKVKKAYVAVGGAVAVGVVGYAWWARSRALQEDTSAPVPDPATGSATGSDRYDPPGGIDVSDPTGEGWRAPRTDQEWSQQVLEKLSWYEPGYVSSVVGRYLAGQTLTAEEANVIREAWAQVGRPPSDQPLRTAATPGPVPTPKPTPVPKPVPKPVPTPKPTPVPKPTYHRVVVVKWTRPPHWRSTISGIAGHYGTTASAVWNDPRNAPLRAKRKRPDLIRTGDVVYVRM